MYVADVVMFFLIKPLAENLNGVPLRRKREWKGRERDLPHHLRNWEKDFPLLLEKDLPMHLGEPLKQIRKEGFGECRHGIPEANFALLDNET